MKRLQKGILYSVGVLMTLLGVLSAPEAVRESRRLARLRTEGLQVLATITRIEESYVDTADDSSDRATYGPSMKVKDASVTYAVAGREYQARHRLSGPLWSRRVGDQIPLLVLPDDAGRSYDPHSVVGNRIFMALMPVLLILGGLTLWGVARLFT